MRTTAILSAAMILLTVTASPALADLCANCRGQMYITSVGKCAECGGTTSSGAFALCKACSAKLGQCEHCRAALGGAPVVRPPAAGDANARASQPAREPATMPAGAVAFRSVVLSDVQGLLGGQDVWLFADGTLVAQTVSPRDRATPCKRYATHVDDKILARMAGLLGEHKFFDMEIASRAGVPDEGRPSITVRSIDVRERTVQKWANDKHAGFDAIYAELIGMVKSAAEGKPEDSGPYNAAWAPKEPDLAPPAGKIDVTQSKVYESGKWKYSYQVTSKPGRPFETMTGTLSYDGEVVPSAGSPNNNFYVTPWGVLYDAGEPNIATEPHGWMPFPGRGPPGKQLPSPGGKGKAATKPTSGAMTMPTSAAKPLTLTEDSDGKGVAAAVGLQIILRLKGNATTGYTWGEPTITGEAVRQEGKGRYVPDAAGGRVGVGGVTEWTLTAAKPGKSEIKLEYSRPWEKDTPAAKTFTLTVEVKPAPASTPASGPMTRAAREPTTSESVPMVPTEIMYWCEPNGTANGCGHEFAVKVKDLPVARQPGDEADIMKIDCPKCGAKKSAWQERKCPSCGKYFVALSTRLHYAALRSGRGDPTGVRDVCPWCKTDLQKWYIEHQPKD